MTCPHSLGVLSTPTTAAFRASAGLPRRVYSAPANFGLTETRLQAGPSFIPLLMQTPQHWLRPHMCDPIITHRVLTPLHSCLAISLPSVSEAVLTAPPRLMSDSRPCSCSKQHSVLLLSWLLSQDPPCFGNVRVPACGLPRRGGLPSPALIKWLMGSFPHQSRASGCRRCRVGSGVYCHSPSKKRFPSSVRFVSRVAPLFFRRSCVRVRQNT